MKQVIQRVTSIFDSKKDAPNPDPAHNAALLEDVRAKIESNLLGRFMSKAWFVFWELAYYGFSLFLAVVGFMFYNSINKLFNIIANVNEVSKALMNESWSFVSWLTPILFIVSFTPALLSFFWARSYTKGRVKINVLREVELALEKVIYNLQNGGNK